MTSFRKAYFNLLQAICFGTNFNVQQIFNRYQVTSLNISGNSTTNETIVELVKEASNGKLSSYDRQVIDLFVSVSSYRSWNRWKYFSPVNNQENPVASNRSELFIGKSSGCRCYKSPVLWFLPHPND